MAAPLSHQQDGSELASMAYRAHNDEQKEHHPVRSISLLTIVALLYCPLACAVGQGYSVGSLLGCETESDSPICCCCSNCPTQSGPRETDDSEPTQNDCQGICNGAVHERHDIRIEMPELACLAPHPAFVDWSTTLRKHDFSLANDHVLSGRQLRTRLLSLTC